MRDHEPIIIEEFNGLWKRGDSDSCPIDHWPDCNNVKFIESGFETRDGIDTFFNAANIRRMYNFTTEAGESLLVWVSGGFIYHLVPSTGDIFLVLQINDMTDFGFVAISGRAYITPFLTNADGIQKALDNEFVYVYLADGNSARKAAGIAPTGTPLVAVQSATAGFNDIGLHIIAVVYETDTGYLTPPGPAVFAQVTTTDGTKRIDVSNIPIPPGAEVVLKHLVATKVIPVFNGDQAGFQFFFIPNGDVAVGATTKSVSFYDLDLLDDASHLIDNYTEIPATIGLTLYHDRMVAYSTFDDISLALVSAVGEPEAISQVDGLVVIPLDGNPILNAQEYRDILYFWKKTRTFAVPDNNDEPSTWKPVTLDQGFGATIHGIATVLDSGGINVDFILIANFTGILIFNGAYSIPELTWKIKDLWLAINFTDFENVQMLVDSIRQIIYINLPNDIILEGDYSNGLDPKNIRWSLWTFDIHTNTIALINNNTLLIGSENV